MTAFTTTYRGPTATRGARIIASRDGTSRATAWDHSSGNGENHRQAADKFARDVLGADPSQMIGAELEPGQWVWITSPLRDK